MNHQYPLGDSAIVIGGSMAGILAARVLSEHYARVTIVERDSAHSNIVYQSLAHGRANRSMDPFELIVPAHGGRMQPMPHEGEEFLTVLKGKVQFEFDGEVHTLREGDSVYFDAETDHRVFNDTDREARVLCVFLERGQ